MNDSDSEADPLAALAEEFVGRYRRGERPALTEYAEKYPEQAARIRRLFPALVDLERVGSVGGQKTGPFAGMHGGPWPSTAAARRIPPPSRGGPRRHGSRLRSSAGIPGPARCAQGASGGRADVPDPPRAIPTRGAGSGAAAPYQYRAGLRRRRARGSALLRHAVHPGSEPGPRPARARTPSPPRPTAVERRTAT